MLDLDQFVEDCRAAVTNDPTHKAVAEIVTRALSDPSNVLAAVGEPTAGGIFPIHRADDLTILNVVWKPGMTLMPHNHEMASMAAGKTISSGAG